MKRAVSLLTLIVPVLGCASRAGIGPNRTEILTLKNSGAAEIHAITYSPAPFTLLSAGKVAAGSLFGIVGGAASASSMEQAGQKLIATLGIEDPAMAVRVRLGAAMNSEFGLQVKTDSAPPSDELDGLKTQFGESTVLETRTMGWALTYYPGDWSHHFLVYTGRARLRRLKDGERLWESYCTRRLQDEKGKHRTVDEYKANNGELLKQRMLEATSGCIDEMLAQLTKQPPKS